TLYRSNGCKGGSSSCGTTATLRPTGTRLVRAPRSLRFSLQRGQGLVIHIPLFQDGKDRLGSETDTHQLAESACRVFLALRLLQTLAVQVVAGLPLFIYLVVNRLHRFIDHFAVDSLSLQVSDHAPASELFVVATE